MAHSPGGTAVPDDGGVAYRQFRTIISRIATIPTRFVPLVGHALACPMKNTKTLRATDEHSLNIVGLSVFICGSKMLFRTFSAVSLARPPQATGPLPKTGTRCLKCVSRQHSQSRVTPAKPNCFNRIKVVRRMQSYRPWLVECSLSRRCWVWRSFSPPPCNTSRRAT